MIRNLLYLFIAWQLVLGTAWAAKTSFVDGNSATRTPGTRVTAAFLNAVNNHRHDGQTVDGSGILDYAVDTGSENAIAIALSPALTAHVAGMPISVKVAVANTGAVTIAVNALTPVALTKRGGTALVSGDLAAGQIIQVAWDGTQYQLVGHEPQELTNVATVGGHTAHQLAPPGTVVAYAAPTVPAGWLACNGQLVSRESYADLFAAIGTTYGAGDNVSTFQLPDLRGEFVRGWDNGRGVDVDRAIGSTQADSLKSHTHTMAAIPNSALPAGVSDGVMTGGITTMNTGATGGSETRPRNVALFYVIKY